MEPRCRANIITEGGHLVYARAGSAADGLLNVEAVPCKCSYLRYIDERGVVKSL